MIAQIEDRIYTKEELYELEPQWYDHMHITEALPDWIWEDQDVQDQ